MSKLFPENLKNGGYVQTSYILQKKFYQQLCVLAQKQ